MAASAQDAPPQDAPPTEGVPTTVEPGAIGQEFRAPREALSSGAVSVPSASGPVAPAGAEREMFVLTALDVEGVTAFPDSAIRLMYSDKIGETISLADLFGIAQDITRLYADAGYPLSVAFLPAQEIEGGAARIAVYEGYVAEVEIAGDPGPARPALERLAAELVGERPLEAATLERYVLLANDLPGITVKSVIDRAAEGPGAVKVIFAAERRAMSFALNVNNRGSTALGRERVQASAALNSILVAGDRLRADIVQTTEAEELTFLSGGYEIPIGSDGFRLGGVVSWSDSAPGTELLEALDFNSEGATGAVEASYPLIRRRSHNLVLGGTFEYDEFESRFDQILNAHDVLWVGRASLALDAAHEQGGASSLRVQVSHGFDLAAATRKTDPDKSRERGDAVFSSLLVDASRVQPLSGSFELSLAGRAQVASRKLLASEECGYGGAGMGRAFDNFEIAGDHCLMATAELRRRPETLIGSLTAAPYGFLDAGHVWTHGPASPGQLAEDNAESVGGGFRMEFRDSFSAYVEYAHPLSHDIALEENPEEGRVFFGLTATR
jgi:hemolysin activation/secretion protein